MNRAIVGHADLVRIFADFPSAPRGLVARLIGWEERAPEPPPLELPEVEPLAPVADLPRPAPEPEPTGDWPAMAAVVPFWRVVRFANLGGKAADKPVDKPEPKLEWRAQRTLSAPKMIPLCPWPALIPRLRSGLQPREQSRRIDWARVVDQTARGQIVRRLPRRSIKRWGESVLVVLDRSDRLIPYWDDQLWVLDRLSRLIPEHGRHVVVGPSPDSAAIREATESGPFGTVLVLSDLGGLQIRGESLQEDWRVWGELVREGGGRPLALVPSAAEAIPAPLQRTFMVLSWQRLPHALVRSEDDRSAAVDQLLCLLAPAIRIEPGLLRQVRSLLPSPANAADDASLEATFWQHPTIASPHVSAATLDAAQARSFLMPLFEALSEDLRKRALMTIRVWRQPLAPEVWFQELARLTSDTRRLIEEPDDWNDARAALAYFKDRAEKPRSDSAAVLGYFVRALTRVTDAAWGDPEIGPVYRQLHRAIFPDAPRPPGWSPSEEASELEPFTVEVCQQGCDLVFASVGPPTLTPRVGGSPVGFLTTANRLIRIDPHWGEDTRNAFWDGGRKPQWAHDWGHDQYGAWVTFRVEEITQKLRWVPPGKLLMGSPVTEEDRFDREGPQHEVTIPQGFWMFDTPCTQQLWLAVVGGENPSQFKGDRRPVERVSWEACQKFIETLEVGLGLKCGLPTEAQWEYTCRAGTTGPRYGSLDDVAWYWENSGNQTHEVKRKAPNPWGLHDMLGNVWEWCQDGVRKYTKEHKIDPLGPTTVGAVRVIRGGSWGSGAQCVRAAYRDADPPGARSYGLGFRCLSSGDFRPERVEPAAEGGGRKAEPVPQPQQAGGTSEVRLDDSGPWRTPFLKTTHACIRSDRHALFLERSPQPEWASASGRDRFGLWADLEIQYDKNKTARQRLRWIPPGRFLMGSPETERGRYDDEGPQHEVKIPAGFWLFDTPCTQELWVAGMGAKNNPSRFQDPLRPVENVSFEAVREFLDQLNAKVPSLGLCLPREAQWEYACRAGTTTSTYAGDVESLGSNNAPGLDAIAWYGGNSGHEYDLETGYNSSEWPEKQYPHTKAGTRRVKQKAPNSWGLYDMLGNIWEWCVDGKREYTKETVCDSSIQSGDDSGAYRVIRGACWGNDARRVRAAFRPASPPGHQDDDFGFRCLSSGDWGSER